MRNKFTYNLVLQHDAKNTAGHNSAFGSMGRSSRSKYSGGFITKNGRKNNSPAYNHDYYIRNKEKWSVGAHDKQEVAFHKDFANQLKRTGKSAQDIYDGDDFDVILAEFGGYDTDSISDAEKNRLRENFKKQFKVRDVPTSEYRARAAVDDAQYNVLRETQRAGKPDMSAVEGLNTNYGRRWLKSVADYAHTVNYNKKKKR